MITIMMGTIIVVIISNHVRPTSALVSVADHSGPLAHQIFYRHPTQPFDHGIAASRARMPDSHDSALDLDGDTRAA